LPTFADLDVRGEVGFYGMADQGQAYLFLSALAEALPEIHVRGEYDEALLDVARATKDADEVARIREVARLTCEVVEETIAFLRRHRVKDETLVTDDGAPLTVGRVKDYVYQLLARRRLESPEGFIFAIGRGMPGSPTARAVRTTPSGWGRPSSTTSSPSGLAATTLT
jgi:hypothetical protein